MRNEINHPIMSTYTVLFRTPIRLYWKCISYLLDYAMYAMHLDFSMSLVISMIKKKQSTVIYSTATSDCTVHVLYIVHPRVRPFGSNLLAIFFNLLKWCCYITVDSAMAASQNGFCSYNLFIRKPILCRL